MKRYQKVILALALLIVFGTGAWLYSRYSAIKSNAIEKQKAQTAGHIQSLASALLRAEDFSDKDSARQRRAFQSFFEAIQSPEIVRMKVWDKNFTVIWATLTELIGQRFPDNHEVKEALEGKVEFEIDKPKDEHVSERQFQQLSEIYVPIRDSKEEIIGVIEVYQSIVSLNDEVKSNFQKVAIPAIIGALISYVILAFSLRYLIKSV